MFDFFLLKFNKIFKEKDLAFVEFIIVLALGGVLIWLTMTSYRDKVYNNRIQGDSQIESGLGINVTVPQPRSYSVPVTGTSLTKPVITTNAVPPYTVNTAFQFTALSTGRSGIIYKWKSYDGTNGYNGNSDGSWGYPQKYSGGIHTVTVVATDGVTSVTSDPFTFTVGNTPEKPAIIVKNASGVTNSGPYYTNQDLYFYAVPSTNPSSSYSSTFTCMWAWSDNPNGTNQSCSSPIKLNFSTPTTLTVQVQVCDGSNGCNMNSITINITYPPISDITIQADPNSTTIKTTDQIRFQVASVTGGSGNYAVTWTNYTGGNISTQMWGSYVTYPNDAGKTVSVTANVCDLSNNICFSKSYNLNVITPFTYIDFDYTGSVQTWTAPYTGNFKLEVWGAQGGNGYISQSILTGGAGGYSEGTINLTAGQTVYIYVGGAGVTGYGYLDISGGFNGGGTAINGNSTWSSSSSGSLRHGSGGGASDIRIGGSSLSNRIIVAGGGGGSGGSDSLGYGTAGGAAGGSSGTQASNSSDGIRIGGRGGTQSMGGAAGTYSGLTGTATNGSLGQGGNSGTINQNYYLGGAGGGGYYGGGGGAPGGPGGGGGSGYIGGVASGQILSGTQMFTSPKGVSEVGQSGNGYARISAS